jgi:hypothetical protein
MEMNLLQLPSGVRHRRVDFMLEHHGKMPAYHIGFPFSQGLCVRDLKMALQPETEVSACHIKCF